MPYMVKVLSSEYLVARLLSTSNTGFSLRIFELCTQIVSSFLVDLFLETSEGPQKVE